MGKLDLTNQWFGRLRVIERAESRVSESGKIRGRWLCECKCGNRVIVLTDDLRNGSTNSCGCYNLECIKSRATKHGMTGSRIYTEWASMKARCYYKGSKCYDRYGARGITVCDEWKYDFQAFYDWAIANGYADNLTIERKDVNGNYCPENCCWIPSKEQAKNRRSTLRVADADGNERYAMDIAKENGISMKNVIARKSKGWTLEDALNTPIIKKTIKRRVLQIDLLTGNVLREYESIGEASRESGAERSSISRCCLGERSKAGGYGWEYANN